MTEPMHHGDCLVLTTDNSGAVRPCTCGATPEPTTGENPAYKAPAVLLVEYPHDAAPIVRVRIDADIHKGDHLSLDDVHQWWNTFGGLIYMADEVAGQWVAGHQHQEPDHA